ncbi:cellulose binding domain-containing protein [Actinacidiphila sp. bgisy167]|uniref:cellulose binding domain-containing protein n=1 Tax=Actinacidiphila sp. bgisy167 TaxID=3413797 RepID=UPI003D75A3E9
MGSARPSLRPSVRPGPPVPRGRGDRRRAVRRAAGYLLLAAAVGAGVTALVPAWRGTHSPPPEITVRYKAGTPVSAATARPWLEVVNTSGHRIRLSDVAIRYYYTQDGGGAPYAFNCVQASVGCSDVDGRTVAMDRTTPTADHYLEVTFSKAAGTLAPGAKSGAVGVQLYRPGGTVDQRDDRSFSAGRDTFQASRLVTGYLDGRQVWGDEPGGGAAPAPTGAASASATASASASAAGTARPAPGAASAAGTARPAPPSGIFFDDFRYSGPRDPALRAHGWLVRTSGGGPGIPGTWSAGGVSFPADKDALGGQVLRLRAATDGTRRGTTQAEVHTTGLKFLTGTFAARIHFADEPAAGRNGDHVNETFFMISPRRGAEYSELDNEYQPNGGWGAPGPRLDTTTWHSAREGDRVTRPTMSSLEGWHTLVTTAAHGVVTYSLDGHELFRTSGTYYPTRDMSANFNAWFVDLPFSGKRTWDMKVDWFYHDAGKAQSLAEVEKAVHGLAAGGTGYADTLREH